jgi:hypothetical protein
LVVFNTANRARTLPAVSVSYVPGTTLVNLLDGEETVAVSAKSQTPEISVPTMTAKIFIARNQQRPLDPVVTGCSPAHDSANVSVKAPLVFRFSRPMDARSVESTFVLAPAAATTFSWSADRTRLTVLPVTNWPTQTLVMVKLGDAAKAGDVTNRLFAAFESRFRTLAGPGFPAR